MSNKDSTTEILSANFIEHTKIDFRGVDDNSIKKASTFTEYTGNVMNPLSEFKINKHNVKINSSIYSFIRYIIDNSGFGCAYYIDTVMFQPLEYTLNINCNFDRERYIDNFDDMNICYFTARYVKLFTFNHTDELGIITGDVNIENITVVIHNESIKIQVFYKMLVVFDEEKCLLNDSYFEANMIGSMESIYNKYIEDNNEIDIIVVDVLTGKTTTFYELFDYHIQAKLKQVKIHTNQYAIKKANDIINSISSPLVKQKVIDHMTNLDNTKV